MKFPVSNRIWKVLDTGARPVLEYALVERTGPKSGTIVGTDGRVAAQIPVELEETEQVGLVHRSTLEQAARVALSKELKRAHNGDVILYLEDDRVRLMGSTLDRWGHGDDPKNLTFPDYRTQAMITGYRLKPPRPAPFLVWNSSLANVCAALDRAYLELFCADDAWVYVHSDHWESDGTPRAPWGAMMGGMPARL